MKKISVRANYAYNMVYQVLNVILPIITTPYIARVLGAENNGIYGFTYSIVSTFVMVGSLGIGTYGQREIAASNDNIYEVSKKFYEIQAVKTIAIIISAVAFVCVSMFSGDNKFYFIIQLPYFLSAILDISWLYQGLENFRIVAVRNIAIKLVGLVLIFTLVRNRSDLIAYLVILSMAQLVGNALMWVSLRKLLVKVKKCEISLLKHIKPTFVYFLPTVSYQVYAVLDRAMLGIIYDDNAENGFYEQAHKLVNVVTMVVSSYTIVMRSKMTTLFAKNDIPSIKQNLNGSMHFIGMLVFPMTFGMAAIAPNIVPWFFGPGYDRVINILRVFSPYFVMMGICTCLGTHILTPSGQQGKSNVGQCISAAANVCFNACLIPFLGAIGAAAASVASEIIIVVSYMHYTKEFMTYRSLFSILYKYLISAVIMFVPTFILAEYLSSSVLNTIIIVCVGVLVYVVSLALLRDLFFLKKCRSALAAVRKKLKK